MLLLCVKHTKEEIRGGKKTINNNINKIKNLISALLNTNNMGN